MAEYRGTGCTGCSWLHRVADGQIKISLYCVAGVAAKDGVIYQDKKLRQAKRGRGTFREKERARVRER